MMLAGGEANVQFARNAGLGEVSPIGYQRCHPKSLGSDFFAIYLVKERPRTCFISCVFLAMFALRVF